MLKVYVQLFAITLTDAWMTAAPLLDCKLSRRNFAVAEKLLLVFVTAGKFYERTPL